MKLHWQKFRSFLLLFGFIVLALSVGPLPAQASDGNLSFNVTYTKSAIAWNYIDASTASIMQGEWLNLKLNTVWNFSSGCWPGADSPTCSPPNPIGGANTTVIWKQESCPAGVSCYWYSRSGPLELTWGIVANMAYAPGIQISNTGGLAPGTYPIVFSVEEHPSACLQSGSCLTKKTFTVNLVVQGPAPQPSISAIPANVNFSAAAGGSAPAANSMTLRNTGSGTLNWTATTSQNWCHVSSTSGSVAAGSEVPLTVSVDAPSNVGTFNCAITFIDPNSSNGNQTVSVTYTVTGTPPPPPQGGPGSPILTSINPTQATLSQVQSQITMDVFGSQFNAVLSNNLPIFTRNADGQQTGIAAISFIPGGLKIYVPANLLVGTYTVQILNGADFINLRSNGLTFTVVPDSPKASILLSPSALNFSGVSGGQTPGTQALVIKNTGTAALDWTSSLSQSWCHVSPASGSIPAGGLVTATVSVDAPTNIGTFNCNLSISGSNTTNSPQAIAVSYQVSSSPTTAVCGFTNTAFRYMKFENIYPVAWAAWRELEFYDTAGNKLKPTIIGGSTDWIYPSQGAYGKPAAIDGNNYTQWNGADAGWVSPFSPPINIVFDFGKTVNLGRMRFLPQNTVARDVNVWVGDSPSNLTTLLQKVQGNYYEMVWIDYNCLSGGSVISLTPSTMAFTGTVGGSAPAGKTLSIYNTGAITMGWSAAADQNWCHVSPTTGTLAGGNTTAVNVTVDAPSNAGSFNCTITISSPITASQSMTVNYTVNQATPAKISLSPSSANFTAVSGSATPSGKTLTISNTGTGDLNWYATANQTWCHIAPASGLVTPGSSTVTTVSVDAPSNIGTYGCTITVSGPNTSSGPQNADVVYNVTAPLSATIALSSNSYTFNAVVNGSAPIGQSLAIRNSGSAVLNWTAAANQTWCRAQPSSGTLLPGAAGNTTISVNAPFGAGTFNCVINISAGNTTNSPQPVNVIYGVSSTPQAIINLFPTSYPFLASLGGPAPSVQTMTLKNTGNANLNWSAAVSQSWCHVSPSSGTLGQGASTNLSVSVDNPSNVGTFNCSLAISQVGNSNNVQQAAVTYKVDTAGISNPSQVTASAVACSVITISWQPGRNATAYRLYKNTVNSLPAVPYADSLSSTSYVDTNVTMGAKYFYWVQSIGSTGATPADVNSFDGATPSACQADLSPSDKNLQAINGVSQPHDDCDYNQFQGAPQSKTLKNGDILTFNINLCNLKGSNDATAVIVTDNLLNLDSPPGGFNVMVNGQPLRYVSAAPQVGEYSYDNSKYELTFNIGIVPLGSAKQITYDAQVKTQLNNVTGCVKCQSITAISFKKDNTSQPQTIDLYTPPIFYSVSKP